jgi:hypothetical protein
MMVPSFGGLIREPPLIDAGTLRSGAYSALAGR